MTFLDVWLYMVQNVACRLGQHDYQPIHTSHTRTIRRCLNCGSTHHQENHD